MSGIRIEDPHPFRVRLLAYARQHERAQRAHVLGIAQGRREAEARILPDRIERERTDEGAELRGRELRELEPDPIPCARVAVGQVRHVGDAQHHRVAGQPVHEIVDAERLHQARLDPAPAAAALAIEQRREDPVQRELRRAPARDRHRRVGRARAAGQSARNSTHAARLGGDETVPRGVVCVGSARPEAGDPTRNGARIARGDRSGIETEARVDARCEAREHDVRLRREAGDALAIALLREVRDARLLAALPHAEGRMRAQRIAAGRLELDHVGAVVGEDQRGHGAGEPGAELEHAQAVGHARARRLGRILRQRSQCHGDQRALRSSLLCQRSRSASASCIHMPGAL